MNKFTKEYISFENKHLSELTNLFHLTKDEGLRALILLAREELLRISKEYPARV